MQNQIISKVYETITKAENVYEKSFEKIPVKCNIKGKTAGMYCWKGSESYLRFNLEIFKNNPDAIEQTVIHEVAHYITHSLHGKVKPHGVEWKNVMRGFGVKNPKRTHSYECKSAYGKIFKYKCDCQEFDFTKIRHNKVLRGAQYICRKCKGNIVKV